MGDYQQGPPQNVEGLIEELVGSSKNNAVSDIAQKTEETNKQLAVLLTEPTDQHYRSTVDSIMAIHRVWKTSYPIVCETAINAGGQKRNAEVLNWVLEGDDVILKEDLIHYLHSVPLPSSNTTSTTPGSVISDTESSLSYDHLKEDEALIEIQETESENLVILKFSPEEERAPLTAPPPIVYTRRLPNLVEAAEVFNPEEPVQGPSNMNPVNQIWENEYFDDWEMNSILANEDVFDGLGIANQESVEDLPNQVDVSEESNLSDNARMSDITQPDMAMQSLESLQCDDIANLPNDSQSD